MTDNEIIKALKCCGRKHNEKNDTHCKNCQFKSYLPCVAFLCDRTIDLINRQKAEIERYKGVIKLLERDAQTANKEIDELKQKNETIFSSLDSEISLNRDLTDIISSANFEAIKEFAEKLKNIVDGDINRIYSLGGIGGTVAPLCKFKDDIDMVLKELTEKNDFKEELK